MSAVGFIFEIVEHTGGPIEFHEIARLMFTVPGTPKPDGSTTWERHRGGTVTIRAVAPAPSPPRCATCRWARPTLSGELVAHPLVCERAEDEPPALANVSDYDDTIAGGGRLSVAPDFGCVMWEAKPMIGGPLHVCELPGCKPRHYDNCPSCFGYGVWQRNGGVVSVPIEGFYVCGDGVSIARPWEPCPTCGSTPAGVPTEAKP